MTFAKWRLALSLRVRHVVDFLVVVVKRQRTVAFSKLLFPLYSQSLEVPNTNHLYLSGLNPVWNFSMDFKYSTQKVDHLQAKFFKIQ